MLRLAVLAFVLLLLPGCWLGVIVGKEGWVSTHSIYRPSCLPESPTTGRVCYYEINDTTFIQTFTAFPNPGWRFVRWNSGGDFFCQDSTNRDCLLSNTALGGIPVATDIINSEKTYYIMPIFEPGIPSITVGDREWAQTDVFRGLSWNEIDAVCPEASGGACSGLLDGYDVTGWIWASDEDMQTLFNSYGVTPPLTPTNQRVDDFGTTWAPAFFDAGWRSNTEYTQQEWEWDGSSGWIRNSASPDTGKSAVMNNYKLDGDGSGVSDFALTDRMGDKTASFGSVGAWIYRELTP
jgi:hypothetical protein